MTLLERIQEDLKRNMKEKNELNVRTLRMVLAALKNYLVDHRDMKDEESTQILVKELKKRTEAAEEYIKAKRPELAQSEEAEAQVIKEYLPKPYTEEELRRIIMETITEIGAKSSQDFGKVMSALIPKTKGRADGKTINVIVKEILSNN